MFAQARKRNEMTATRKTTQPTHAAPTLASSDPRIVQRKAACACGGTCPHCMSEHLQAKLSVSEPGDPLEREADHVADTVMRMPHRAAANHARVSMQPLSIHPASGTGKKSSRPAMWSTGQGDPLEPSWFDDEQDTTSYAVQRAAGTDTKTHRPGVAVETELGNLPQGGTALSREERQFFEPRFGSDFGSVRIHADARADRLARAINAEAFTVGSHIAFRSERYAPQTESGRHLLAHELTHVVQQTGGNPAAARQIQRTIGDGHDLAAPRFSGNVTLEAAFDDELLVRRGAKGEPVRLIQESLREMGYALPLSVSRLLPGRMDGDFGPETEAAVTRFQTDAGAVLIDGIVGPETMGLLDTHDVSRPAARPPATTGPMPPPLAATDCDARFTGVTFALANQVASGTAAPADIRIALVGGLPFLIMRGLTPITYHPEITITAPNDATAQQFRIGFSQTLLTSSRVANYSGGGTVATIVPTLPIKDGAPNDYHPIYVTNPGPDIVEDYGATGDTATLTWPDVPGDGAFINLNDNPSCATAALPAQSMTSMRMNDEFRIWVVAQHRPSGCVRALHHVDWNLVWSATVTTVGGVPTVAVTSNINNVTEPDGNGSPRFVQGGNVPGEIAFTACI
jgi:peptidoglycan hydrolase-like protein with peptidoglycan-binding domain